MRCGVQWSYGQCQHDAKKRRFLGPRAARTLIPQPEGPHTVVTKPLRIDSPILRGQQSCTSSGITKLDKPQAPHRSAQRVK